MIVVKVCSVSPWYPHLLFLKSNTRSRALEWIITLFHLPLLKLFLIFLVFSVVSDRFPSLVQFWHHAKNDVCLRGHCSKFFNQTVFLNSGNTTAFLQCNGAQRSFTPPVPFPNYVYAMNSSKMERYQFAESATILFLKSRQLKTSERKKIDKVVRL